MNNIKLVKKKIQQVIKKHFEKAYYDYKKNTELISERISLKLSQMDMQEYNKQYKQLEKLIDDLKQKQNNENINYASILYELQSIENQLQMFIGDHQKMTQELKILEDCQLKLEIDQEKMIDNIKFKFQNYEEEYKEEESLLLFQSLEPQLQIQQKEKNQNEKIYKIYDDNSNKASKTNQNNYTNDATKLSFFQASQENTENFFSNLYQDNKKINNKKTQYNSVDKKPINRFKRCGSMRSQTNLLPRVKKLGVNKQNSLSNNRDIRNRNLSSSKRLTSELSFSKIEKIPPKSALTTKNNSNGRDKSPLNGKKQKTLKVQRIQISKFQLEKILTKYTENSEISRINFRKNEFIIDPLEIIYQFFPNTIQKGLTVDLRQNQISYSQWVDSQKQKLESKNIKILIQLSFKNLSFKNLSFIIQVIGCCYYQLKNDLLTVS